MAPYLFIDGGYFRARLKDISKEFEIDFSPLDFNYREFAAVAQKAFYYDCLPAKGRPKENEEDYDRRVEQQRRLLKAIKSSPAYHVFLGEAIRSGGDIVQKGVDVLIAVHMLTHSFRGVIDRAILFAGDRDFEPLVSAVVQQGVYVTVAYHPKSVAEELLDAADDRDEYDTAKLWNLAVPQFKRRHPAPIVGESADMLLSFEGECSEAKRRGCTKTAMSSDCFYPSRMPIPIKGIDISGIPMKQSSRNCWVRRT